MATFYTAEEAKELILSGKAHSGMRVRETLDLNESQVSSLPENFEVDGNLLIADTLMSELPKGLVVDGHLYITDTDIEDIPEDARILGQIIGGPGQMDIINEKLEARGSSFKR